MICTQNLVHTCEEVIYGFRINVGVTSKFQLSQFFAQKLSINTNSAAFKCQIPTQEVCLLLTDSYTEKYI